jgi:formylmethanofuran dehydrogenase subunit E
MSMKEFVDLLNSEQRKALLEALTGKEINTSVNPQPQETDTEHNITEDFQVKKQNNLNKKRKEAVQASHNTWKDTGEDRHIETPNASITPRNRAKPKTKSVKCHVCGKTNNVRSNLVYGEYYRCDSCIG